MFGGGGGVALLVGQNKHNWSWLTESWQSEVVAALHLRLTTEKIQHPTFCCTRWWLVFHIISLSFCKTCWKQEQEDRKRRKNSIFSFPYCKANNKSCLCLIILHIKRFLYMLLVVLGESLLMSKCQRALPHIDLIITFSQLLHIA